MDQYAETINTWNNLAEEYQKAFMDIDLYHESYDLFCELVQTKGPKILEIGCGPGNITRYLISKRSDIEIQGTDVAPEMIRLASMNNPTAKFSILDARQLDRLSEKYHGIISGFCIPYLSEEDVHTFIVNCNHLLHEKGILYLSFVEGDYEKSDYQTGKNNQRLFFYYHSTDNIKIQLTNIGFKEIQTLKIDYDINRSQPEVHTIILAKK